MKYAEVKLNSILISPYNSEWKVVKKYAKDMWLIKRNNKTKLVCVLMGGQVRKGWTVK